MCKACVHENQFIKTKFRRGFGEERVWAQRWVSDEKKKIGSERVRGECRRIERTPLLCTILHVYYYFISDSKTIQFSHNLRDDCFVHRCTCKTLIVDATGETRTGCASLAFDKMESVSSKIRVYKHWIEAVISVYVSQGRWNLAWEKVGTITVHFSKTITSEPLTKVDFWCGMLERYEA